jgi:hypothetical protein
VKVFLTFAKVFSVEWTAPVWFILGDKNILEKYWRQKSRGDKQRMLRRANLFLKYEKVIFIREVSLKGQRN